MANTSLPNLTERTATANTDLIHVNSGGTDYKETKGNFLSDVNSSISALNNSLATKTGTFTKASAFSGSYPSVTIGQSGHVVSVYGFINTLNISSTYGTTLGTVSGVSLPAQAVRFLCNYGDNAYTTGTPTYMSLDTDGSLTLYPTTTGNGKAVFFMISYVT